VVFRMAQMMWLGEPWNTWPMKGSMIYRASKWWLSMSNVELPELLICFFISMFSFFEWEQFLPN
jgi:hypothetical protein